MHVNRLNQAYKRDLEGKRAGKMLRKQQIRRQEPEADEPALLAPGPMSIPAPQDESATDPWNHQSEPATPNGHPCISAPFFGRLWIAENRSKLRSTRHTPFQTRTRYHEATTAHHQTSVKTTSTATGTLLRQLVQKL